MTNRERPEIITRSYSRRLVYVDFGKPQADPVLYFHGACSHIGLYPEIVMKLISTKTATGE